jgi:hypothetical protein
MVLNGQATTTIGSKGLANPCLALWKIGDSTVNWTGRPCVSWDVEAPDSNAPNQSAD